MLFNPEYEDKNFKCQLEEAKGERFFDLVRSLLTPVNFEGLDAEQISDIHVLRAKRLVACILQYNQWTDCSLVNDFRSIDLLKLFVDGTFDENLNVHTSEDNTHFQINFSGDENEWIVMKFAETQYLDPDYDFTTFDLDCSGIYRHKQSVHIVSDSNEVILK